MKTKIFSVLMVLMLVLGLNLMRALPAVGTINPVHNLTTLEDYNTIQEAIDDADPGNIIQVDPGNYTEDLSIDKSLTLQGNGSDTTNITGSINITLGWDNEVVVTTPLASQGGVLSDPLVEAVIFTFFNVSSYIYLSVDNGSSVTIINNTLYGIECGDTTLDNGSTVTIESNEISGDGISFDSVTGNSTLDITYNNIYENADDGISITNIFNSTVTIDNNAIYDNSVDGVYIDEINDAPGTLTVSNNDIYGNGGYGLYIDYIYHSTVNIDGNAIYDNGSDGINIDEINDAPDTVTVSNNDIYGNDSDGLYFDYIYTSTVDVTGNDIYENGSDGIEIYEINDAPNTVTISGNAISSNGDSGFYNEYIYSSTLNIVSNNFTGNDGDGIYIDELGYDEEPEVGFDSTVTITDNIMESNYYGLEISYVYYSSLLIRGNVATLNEEGIFIEDCYDDVSEVTIDYNTLSNNDYGLDFDCDFDYPEKLTVINNNFVGNSEYGVYNDTGEDDPITAIGNWWGAVSGPYHPETNPGGLGNEVSDDVIYDPWLTAAVVYPVPPPPPPPPLPQLPPVEFILTVNVDFLMNIKRLSTDYQGVLLETYTGKTQNGEMTIVIEKGTQMLDASGQPIILMTVEPLSEDVPPPPDNLIGLAYDFGPDGAQFNPPFTLSMVLPEGVDPATAKIAYWTGTEWVELATTYDPATKTLTALVSHFTPYAIIYSKPAPTTPVVTTPAPTIPAPTTPAPTTPAPTTPAPTTPAPTTPAPTTPAPTTPAPTTPATTPAPTVTVPTAPALVTEQTNWWLIGGLIVGGIFVILLLIVYARRRRD